ncbi:cytosine-specific methyltransferase [Phlyctema vagabunda]|uniref:DNA (cytosine-5-)-methyltransferase n=1 Tax=Phlyctema vagabunda TaxID=108571 RepID=A0ABR4PS68_9HELO
MPPAIYRQEDGPHDEFLSSQYSDEYFDAVSKVNDLSQEEESNCTASGRSSPLDFLQQDFPISLTPPNYPQYSPINTHSNHFNNIGPRDGPESEENGRGHDGEPIQPPANLPAEISLKSLEPAGLIYPKSLYRYIFSDDTESFELHTPKLPVSEERTAVQALLEEIDQTADDGLESICGESSGVSSDIQDFVQIELSDFTVYLPPKNTHHPYEMRPLDHLASRTGSSVFLFDGFLSIGQKRHYVEGVPFEICSLGNYGKDHHCVGDQIWIQSRLNKTNDIYYHLNAPSPEYARFHIGFLWVADLAKHFVDYCISSCETEKSISIHHFRKDFSAWMIQHHGGSSMFRTWYQEYQGSDFRGAVNQNIKFLHKEALGVDEDTRKLAIWGELLNKTTIRKQPILESKTVVTQYVYECFSHMRFGHNLKCVHPNGDAKLRQTSQGHSLQLTIDENCTKQDAAISLLIEKKRDAARSSYESLGTDEGELKHRKEMIKSIVVGDTISVVVDGIGSVWKDEVTRWKAADDCWYLLVQKVYTDENDLRTFDGLWLYKPSDTTCAKMKYPYVNELFLSDHCTCKDGRETEENVIDVVSVCWHGTPESSQGLFVRQTYMDGERFVTLKDTHKQCDHLRPQRKVQEHSAARDFKKGETVLVMSSRIRTRKCINEAEPYEVVENIFEGTKHYVLVKRLLRRVEFSGQMTSASNELIYTDKLDKVHAHSILHRCLVRFYTEADIRAKTIPAPYCRNGTGNAFYITTKLGADNGTQYLEPIQEKDKQSLVQGFDPFSMSNPVPLRGLDLYCGGGNFGRGLEEGGAVHHEWAVDLAENAIHTYHANLTDPTSCKLFFGSVDDLLLNAFRGNPRKSSLIPAPGDVEFISAGSPCQGFSLLNAKKNNAKGLKNQSLVASVAAYVDFYRPKYGLLENVLNMAQKGPGRDEDVLSQLICSIVGMGYQTQVFVLDAWSCGSPQSRSRLFLSFAAPGYEAIQHPELSHSHPPNVRTAAVGLKSNGESFGSRKFGPTPFQFVTAEQATADLPWIGDGRTYHCTPHPDHIVARTAKEMDQHRIACIPVVPRGMTFAKTWNNGNGRMTKAERTLFPVTNRKGEVRLNVMDNSKAWGRVRPDSLFSTITVTIGPEDARMGRCIHWDQHRYMSLMEGRRAQSFPDDEILVGLPSDRWKIVGNSVARTVALALGLKLREAWEMRPANITDKGSKAKTKYAVILPSTKTKHKNKNSGSLIDHLNKLQLPSDLPGSSDNDTAEFEPLSRDELVMSISSASSIRSEMTNSSSKKRVSSMDEEDPRPFKITKRSDVSNTSISTKIQGTSRP